MRVVGHLGMRHNDNSHQLGMRRAGQVWQQVVGASLLSNLEYALDIDLGNVVAERAGSRQ